MFTCKGKFLSEVTRQARWRCCDAEGPKGAAPRVRRDRSYGGAQQDRAGGRRSCEACEHGEIVTGGVPCVIAARIATDLHGRSTSHIRLAYPGGAGCWMSRESIGRNMVSFRPPFPTQVEGLIGTLDASESDAVRPPAPPSNGRGAGFVLW